MGNVAWTLTFKAIYPLHHLCLCGVANGLADKLGVVVSAKLSKCQVQVSSVGPQLDEHVNHYFQILYVCLGDI